VWVINIDPQETLSHGSNADRRRLLPPTGHRSHQSSHSGASPDLSHSLFISCEVS
ncbi:MAG: hypothetical protein QOJ51_4254, partial [Acidobacteriaceae bacterium]|nr:hypothetical protein [Acidobacteriaceae bacterium]